MQSIILNFFWQKSSTRLLLAVLFIYLLFAALVMPYGAAKIAERSGHSVEIFDLKFCYTKDDAAKILSAYNPAARNTAIIFSLVADTLYPIVYTLLFIVANCWLFKKLKGQPDLRLLLLPLIIMCVDLCENLSIVRLMNNYPNLTYNMVKTASLFTSLKWTFVGIQFLFLAVSIIYLIYTLLRNRLQ